MYLIQTVQTSWRPQLPLPTKELNDCTTPTATDEQEEGSAVDCIEMERARHQITTSQQFTNIHRKNNNNSLNSTSQNGTTVTNATTKKWSFGRLFRRKKETTTDSSSEEDRKAGFTPMHRATARSASGASNTNLKSKSSKTNKVSRSSKLNGASFDHIVLNPQTGSPITPPHPSQLPPQVDHEFFLPVETISPSESYYQNQQPQYLHQQQQQQQHMLLVGCNASRSSNSLDRRAARAAYKMRSSQRLPPQDTTLGVPHSSSEEELISLNSSTFSKYRSDESIHSGGQGAANNAQSRRSRAARNERYYKRLSRDGETSTGQIPVMYAPQPAQRWKTQPVPLSIYNPAAAQATSSHATAAPGTPRLRNTGSLQHAAPYVQWGQLPHQQQLQQEKQQPKNLQNTVSDAKRSISYDSHIHLQNINGRLQTKPLPPPPPPRDPLRRVNVSGQIQIGTSSNDLRPVSYAFDQSGLPVLPATNLRLSSRCVSDDKIWAGIHASTPLYQSVHSLNAPLSVGGQQESNTPEKQSINTPSQQHRRFITRAERDAHPGKKSLPNGLEFHYVADATPRSRKSIHMLEPHDALKEPNTSMSILRTTKSGLALHSPSSSTSRSANDFWQRLDAGAQRRGREVERKIQATAEVHEKPRSISSSRLSELRAYPIPIYSKVQKPQRELQPSPQISGGGGSGVDEVDNVVCGSLHIKSKPDNVNANYVEIRNKDYSKSNSMPNHYQRRSGEIPNTPNKYDEYVAEKREQHHKPIFATPTPPQRNLSIPPNKVTDLPIYFPRKKPANLEEAINELEAIYKSLGLTEPPEDKDERIPTPSDFEKYALAHADDYNDDEDSPAGEPDPIRDDVAYRNMQLANLQYKTAEKQPPFGIPIGPVVAAPQTDYLHVSPAVEQAPLTLITSTPLSRKSPKHAPDIVKDDLAVRALRKDPPVPKDKFIYPYTSFQKKNRATRTQSANIYNLIQRDAAKPSGGDLHAYLDLTNNAVDRAGSLSDLRNDAYKESASDVPTTLALLRNLKEQEQEQLIIAPTKKISSIPFRHPSQGGAICALPEKLPSNSGVQKDEVVHKPPVPLPRKSLTPEPTAANTQMEDALNKIAKDAQEKSMKLTKELQELRKEALITSARPKVSTTVANTSNGATEEERLEKDLQEIEAVSEAAKRCGKMLLDTLPDAKAAGHVQVKPRKLYKEGKLIEAIDQVSEAANAVCEKILKDIVTTEPPVVIQEAVKVKNRQVAGEKLVTPNLIKKLDPIQSEKIEAIAKRCMRQISELANNPDYDNLNQGLKQQQQEREQCEQQSTTAATVACNAENIVQLEVALKNDNPISTVAEEAARKKGVRTTNASRIEEIDQIMQECEAKMRTEDNVYPSAKAVPPPLPLPNQQLVVNAERKPHAMRLLSALNSSSGDDHTTAPTISSNSSASGGSINATTGVIAKMGASKGAGASTTASSFSSSSDCLAKSSSPSFSASAGGRRRQSSSITSFNPYSSSDYLKSSSSEYHTPSTDPIKTFSTSSYDAQTSATCATTPNISGATTNNSSTFSSTPSPPPALTATAPTLISECCVTTADSRAASSAAEGIATLHRSQERQQRTSSRSRSPSQYNSSEELAMIFGSVDEQPKRLRVNIAQHASSDGAPVNVTGKNDDDVCRTVHANAPPIPLPSFNHASAVHVTLLDATTTTTITTASASVKANELETNPQAIDVAKHLRNATVIINNNVNAVLDVNDVIVYKNTTTSNTSSKTPNSTSPIPINNPPNVVISHINNNTNPSYRLSPNSCKLDTIPELQNENSSKTTEDEEKERGNDPPHAEIKLSNNFNKIYASKIRIVVDNVTEQTSPKNIRLTQCDSLSSGEDETSSNPDSGNVSLADFPLTTQTANVCVQFENACNDRYEIKKSFLNEVRIEQTKESNHLTASAGNADGAKAIEEFPPPPSEKELLDSLVEEISEIAIENRDNFKKSENEREKEDEALARGPYKQTESSLAKTNMYDTCVLKELKYSQSSKKSKEATTELAAPVLPKLEKSGESQALSSRSPTDGGVNKQCENHSANTQKPKILHELDDGTNLIELAQLIRTTTSSSRQNNKNSTDINDTEAPKSMPNESSNSVMHLRTDLDHLRLAFNELLERNLHETDELPSIVEVKEEEEDEEFLRGELEALEVMRPHSADMLSAQTRRCSIAYETLPLNLNLSEVKIDYNTKDETEYESLEADNEPTTKTVQESDAESEEETLSDALNADNKVMSWQQRRKEINQRAHNDNVEERFFNNETRYDYEKPATSKAAAASTAAASQQKHTFSIFGELYPAAGLGAAPAATIGGLTTLEHVLLACSLGFITPTDLYTLCLIIVGMIVLIALILF